MQGKTTVAEIAVGVFLGLWGFAITLLILSVAWQPFWQGVNSGG